MSDAALHIQPSVSLRSFKVRTLEDSDLCEIVRSSADSEQGRDAFAELYRRYRDVALAQARSMTRDTAAAEDLVSETFTRVLRALRNGKGPTESVLGYVLISLRSEAIRVSYDESASISVAPDALTELCDDSVPDFSEAISEREQIGRAYALLPEDARQVLWLLDVEQVTTEAAGQHLGMQTGAVRVLAHRARKKLATVYLQQYVNVSTPDCAHVAALLAAHVRGELGKRSGHVVHGHLPGCLSCSAQVSRLKDLAGQLRAWAGPVLIGGGIGAGAMFAGGGATGAAATSSTSSSLSATSQPAVSANKVFAWIGLAAGVALLVAGAFTLVSKDPVGAEPVPATESSTSDTNERSPGEATSPQLTAPNGASPRSGQAPGAEVTEPLPKLAEGEPNVPQDDATPGWKLRN